MINDLFNSFSLNLIITVSVQAVSLLLQQQPLPPSRSSRSISTQQQQHLMDPMEVCDNMTIELDMAIDCQGDCCVCVCVC
jgi:hypothetical protein